MSMTNKCRCPAQTLYVKCALTKTEKCKPTGKYKSKCNIKSNKTKNANNNNINTKVFCHIQEVTDTAY